MKPYYEDLDVKLYAKDCRQMTELADNSIQCVVTSPPYWGLRKYSGEQELIWGGDKDCEHQWGKREYKQHSGRGDCQKSGKYSTQEPVADMILNDHTCSLCGAWKGAYGLEPTPEMYVQHTIEILREIRRVLRKDGVVFWNIGDSYNGSGGAGGDYNEGGLREGQPKYPGRKVPSLKPKDLCLIPFRIAIAAQEDGWWVRSVIIWSKPNPMPESVTDRPTESHEYILMLTKSARYYWDQEAVREPHKPETVERYQYGYKESERDKLGHSHHGKGYQRNDGSPIELNAGRNIRTVWEFPTQPFKDAHFAVFPEKLPELCIKAATPEVGCCSKCGAPWTRVIKKGFTDHRGETQSSYPEGTTAKRLAKLRQAAREQGKEYQNTNETLGWQPTCKCWEYARDLPIIDGVGFKQPYPKVPSIVLDPFAGAGTTLWEAKKLNRRATGYEISEEYCQLIVDRCRQQTLDFTAIKRD